MYDFGSRLRQLRSKKNLTQKQISKRLNVDSSTISAYENNIKMPSLGNLTKIAMLFNVSTDYLLGLEPQEMINVTGLTDRQKDIVDILLLEFNANNRFTK